MAIRKDFKNLKSEKVARGAIERAALRSLPSTFLPPLQQVSCPTFHHHHNLHHLHHIHHIHHHHNHHIWHDTHGQAIGVLVMWSRCLPVLLNSPLRLPALDLCPMQPTEVRFFNIQTLPNHTETYQRGWNYPAIMEWFWPQKLAIFGPLM